MLEATTEAVRQYVAPDGRPDPSRLVSLPTLMLPETGDGRAQVAKIGCLHHVTLSGTEYRYHFEPLREIPSERVAAAANALGIGRFGLSRHYWAVKDADLYGVLLRDLAPTPSPRVFTLPTSPREDDLVAVMMPFSGAFSPVYEALKEAVAAVGLRCQRADDIWENDSLMADIVSLIWRSRIVISDLTDKNPNVFYETGIAHTMGRDVIQITQSAADVPFDLRHLRYVSYLSNGEGLERLKTAVSARVRDLTVRS